MARKDSAIDMNAAEDASASTSDTEDVPALDLPQGRQHRLSVVTAAVSRQVRSIKASTPQYPLVKFVLKKRAGNGMTKTEAEVAPQMAQGVSTILSRPLTALKCTGLRHVPKIGKSTFNLSFIFCCIVLLAILANFGRLCGGYTLSDDIQVMSTQILYHMFSAQVMFTSIIFVFGVTPRLVRFLNRYEKYREVNKDSGEMVATEHAANLVKRTFTGICILLLSPVIVEGLSYFLLPWVTARASRPFKYSPANVAAFVPWHIILGFINTIPVCFIFVACRLLQYEFSAVNVLFRKTLAGKPDSERLELVRLRHATLLEVVSSLDDAVSPYVLLTCVCDVTLLAFHSSVFSFNESTLTSHRAIFIITRLISFLCVATHFFTMMASAVALTNTAKSSKHLIRKINTLNLSDVEFKTLQTFSMTMTYDHIGLTAMKIFDITRTSVSLMTSLSVSYIIFLVALRLTWFERKCEVNY